LIASFSGVQVTPNYFTATLEKIGERKLILNLLLYVPNNIIYILNDIKKEQENL
jgi:hypothetical protein